MKRNLNLRLFLRDFYSVKKSQGSFQVVLNNARELEGFKNRLSYLNTALFCYHYLLTKDQVL